MNKQRLVIGSLLLFIILTVGMVVLAVMAETHISRPGDWGYGLQSAAEAVNMRLLLDSGRRFEYALEAAEFYLADLVVAENPVQVDMVIDNLVQVLNTASRVVNKEVDEEDTTRLGALKILFIQANQVLSIMGGELATPAVVQLRAEINAALSGVGMPNAEGSTGTPMLEVTVPLLVASYDHTQIALSGTHAQLGCLECHLTGIYSDTRAVCRTCHGIPEPTVYVVNHTSSRMRPDNLDPRNLYPNHFEGECQDCHGLENWDPISFTHAGILECASCHAQDVPVDAVDPARSIHYSGDCMLCHANTADWGVASFNHRQFTDCASCHDWEKPALHYEAFPFECHDCHIYTDAWEHTGYHEAYRDCASCHADETPIDHYALQCSSCHITEDWVTANYRHDRASLNCLECHTIPDEAHYIAYDCLACHTVIDWQEIIFEHTDAQLNCADCHAVPDGHWLEQCYNCHISTSDWTRTTFGHTVYADCRACHLVDSPPYHPGGQCSLCHTIISWGNIVTATPPPVYTPTPVLPTPTATPVPTDILPVEPTPAPPSETPIPTDVLPVEP